MRCRHFGRTFVFHAHQTGAYQMICRDLVQCVLRRDLDVVIYGFGDEGRRFLDVCKGHGINVAAILDDKAASTGGQAISFNDYAARPDAEKPVFVLCSHSPDKMRKALTDRFATIQWLPLSAFQVYEPTVFTPHIFYEGLISDLVTNATEISALRTILEDAKSRDVLDGISLYRTTFEYEALRRIYSQHYDDDCRNLLKLNSEETYVDGGTFDGDTIDSFLDAVEHGYAAIHAFEPSAEQSRYLERKYSSAPRIFIHQNAISDVDENVSFSDHASRSAMIQGEPTNTVVQAVALDTCDISNISFIKLNIEGSELDALAGSRNLIRACKPKLAIHSYHRPPHLWQVPKAIKEIWPGYRLYLRHHDLSLMETVCYAIPG